VAGGPATVNNALAAIDEPLHRRHLGADDATTHVLRHVRDHARPGRDGLVIVAELLGHARLETTRGYTRPSAEDRTRALDLLLVVQ